VNASAEEISSDRPVLGWLSWHVQAVARVATAVADQRLPHALLVHGPAGVGKDIFAWTLAAALHCRERVEAFGPCGHCAECALSAAGSHPDLHVVRRPDDRKTISVDQVRELSDALAMTSMRRGYRMAIVTPAHLMTPNAQNALLKTLEEPAPRTLLLLVTSRPSGLLATLRSRCQRIEIARPELSEAHAWLSSRLAAEPPVGLLELAGGSPLRALELADRYAPLEAQMLEALEALVIGRAEVTVVANDLLGEGLPVRLDWFEHWLGAVVRARTPATATQLTLPGGALLQRTAATVNITAVFNLIDRIREARRLLDSSASAALLVESLLVEFVTAFGHAGGR
jgi:DNA polymerase-3 subunit delta'